MKIKRHLAALIHPSSSGSLLTDHCSGASLSQIEQATLLAVVLGATVVLATGCSSTGTGFSGRLISPVANDQQATNSEDDSFYQPPRSPGLDPDLFGG
jgi:hypothetical protein